MNGIEPLSTVLETVTLPLCYTHVKQKTPDQWSRVFNIFYASTYQIQNPRIRSIVFSPLPFFTAHMVLIFVVEVICTANLKRKFVTTKFIFIFVFEWKLSTSIVISVYRAIDTERLWNKYFILNQQKSLSLTGEAFLFYALLVELADTLDLGSRFWGFNSLTGYECGCGEIGETRKT